MDKPQKTRRWFQFSLMQIVESVAWVAIGLVMIKSLRTMSEEMKNSIWIFAWFFIGAPFGAAIGALFRQRLIGAVLGIFVLFAVMLVVKFAFAILGGEPPW